MLSVEEALLMKAVQDEIEAQESMQMGGAAGAVTGGVLGAAAGTIPHKIGNALNGLRDGMAAKKGMTPVQRPLRALKPGPRMAGGLTGLILGGGLGAGMAAIMKRESDAGKLLGKVQAQGGELDELDRMQLSQMLGDIYNSPSQLT